MNANYRTLTLAALVCAALAPTRAAELPLPRDGWVSWQVPSDDADAQARVIARRAWP